MSGRCAFRQHAHGRPRPGNPHDPAHGATSSVSRPTAGYSAQTDTIDSGPGRRGLVGTGAVAHFRKREVRVLGLQFDVHLPPLRVLLAGAVPRLMRQSQN